MNMIYKRTIKFAALFLLIISIASCGGDNYEFVYFSTKEGNPNLYITDTDTSFSKKLTDNPNFVYSPSWHPDGNKVLFTHFQRTGSDLFVVDVSTLETIQLTTTPQKEISGSFSSDGSQIVFTSEMDTPTREIYIMNSDGTNIKRLTVNNVYEGSPSFSPDGKNIIFTRQFISPDSTQTQNGELVLMEISTGAETRLTDTKEFEGLGVFSPDGKMIAFHRCYGSRCDIFVMNSDGSNEIDLTKGIDDNRWPQWSPDGKYLVYTRVADRNSEIWMMKPDGSEKKLIVSSDGRDETAVFRPN